MIAEIYRRVARWNGARYERELNIPLSEALLLEELKETLEARTEVERLDGLCDIQYVALGVLWKSGAADEFDPEDVAIAQALMMQMLQAGFRPIDCVATLITSFRYDMEMPVNLSMFTIIMCTQAEMAKMGLTELQAHGAMLAVCAANDTKSVKKVAADVKANDGDKGEFFTPPEPVLQAILDKRGSHVH